MVCLNDLLGRGGQHVPQDIRQRMIQETSVFLSWALSQDRGLPPIPMRRVDEGGFARLTAHPAGRMLVTRWWDRALGAAWQDR